jgi:oligopeptide transport system substrate-binding protein
MHQASPKEICISLSGWPHTLAPQKVSFTNEIPILMLNYEGLTRVDAQLQTVPGAAERWTYNHDATAITFTLRDHLVYSDGTPLTAHDFQAAVYRALDPRKPGSYQSLLSMIQGADQLLHAPAESTEEEIRLLYSSVAVSVPDARTLSFAFTQPTPYFHTLASTWVFYPAKQVLIDKGGETWHTQAELHVGNGPFRMTALRKDENEIRFEANHHYWNGKPQIDKVRLLYIDDAPQMLDAYRNGTVDICAPHPRDISTITRDAVLSQEFREYTGSCTMVIGFALSKPPFNNQHMREAFLYAFDRKAYIQDVMQNTLVKTLTWIPQGYPGYDPDERRFDFDPERARQCLAQAGYPNGQGLPAIKFTYGTVNPAVQSRVEYLVQMYKEHLNITLHPYPLEDRVIAQLRQSPDTCPEMLIGGGWCADYPDPQNWLSVYWHSRTNIAQSIGYNNPTVDRLLDEADCTPDERARLALYQQAQKHIVGDAPHIILGNAKNTYLVKSTLQGIEVTAQDWIFPGQMTGLHGLTRS